MVFGAVGAGIGGGDGNLSQGALEAKAAAMSSGTSVDPTIPNPRYLPVGADANMMFIGIAIVLILIAVWYWFTYMKDSMYAGNNASAMHGTTDQKTENFNGSAVALGVNETKGTSKKGLFKQDPNDSPEVAILKENFKRDSLDRIDWNNYLVKQNVDDQLKSNHRDFVYRQNMLRTRGGTASHDAIFVPTDAVPWVGLRRPEYWAAFRPGARYVPSVDATQLPSPARGDTLGL